MYKYLKRKLYPLKLSLNKAFYTPLPLPKVKISVPSPQIHCILLPSPKRSLHNPYIFPLQNSRSIIITTSGHKSIATFQTILTGL